MPTILTIIDHYLPSYKAGGPIRSIAGTVEALGDEFELKIVTSDRDFDDSRPFNNVPVGQWTSVGKAKVLYLSPDKKRLSSWKRLLTEVQYDFIYLDSFFTALTVTTLYLHKTRQIPHKPILLAVRGELSPESLSLKWIKKRFYLLITKSVGFYDAIQFHASSENEKKEIVSTLNIKENIAHEAVMPVYVAADLPAKLNGLKLGETRPVKQRGSARIVFLSRVARKKNLDLAIQLLFSAKGTIQFDIWGPLEDLRYWAECQEMIKQLPPNVAVKYQGMAHPGEVVNIFSQYHLFLFPTRNENFGHVILESLCAGCLVLTSNATRWRNLAAYQVGWDLPLSDLSSCQKAINDLTVMDASEFDRRSEHARNYGHDFVKNLAHVEATRNMFLCVLKNAK